MVSKQVSSMLFPDQSAALVSMSCLNFRRVINGRSEERRVVNACSYLKSRLFHDVNHHSFWLQQLMAVWSLLLQDDSEGPTFIFCTACALQRFLTQADQFICGVAPSITARSFSSCPS